MIVRPIVIIGRAPNLVVSACDTPAQMITVPAVAKKVIPVLSEVQPSTCWT